MISSSLRQALIVAGLLLSLTTFGTVGFHTLTEHSWLESLYLAVITMTTLGSRDAAENPSAMLFVIFYMVSGLGIFSYCGFQLGQLIVNSDLRRLLEMRRMQRNIESVRDHHIVCGAGRMGLAICEYLEQRRHPFVLIDHDPKLLQELGRERQWLFVIGDATDDATLRRAGIERAAALATALPTDADNLYVVLSSRILSNSLQIVARASDQSAVQKLQRAGASRVISPFTSGAVKMAKLMLSPRIEDFLEITDESGSDLALVEVQVDASSPYVNRTLAQTGLGNQGVIVIGIRRVGGQYLIAPGGGTQVELGDSLFAFGRSSAVQKFTD